jgi:hypothetical protein
MDETAELSSELQSLRNELVFQFRREQWSSLAGTLEAIARLGEEQGRRELCLRAQTLRELMDHRGAPDAIRFDRVTEVYDELLFHLKHLQWVNQASH